MRRLHILLLTFFSSFLLGQLQAQAQQADTLQQPSSTNSLSEFDEDVFSLETPRRAVTSHLRQLQEDRYSPDSAALVLFSDELGKERMNNLAIQLKQIYDGEGYLVYPEDIPDEVDYKDSLGRSRFIIYAKYPEIYVEKIGDKWQYSKKTVNSIPQIHDKIFPFGTDFLVNIIPRFGEKKVLGLKLWKWVGIFLLFVVLLLSYWFFDWLFSFLIQKVIPIAIPRAISIDSDLIHSVARPFSFLLVILILRWLFPVLQLPASLGQYIFLGLTIMSSVFGIATVYKLVDLIAEISIKLANRTDTALDDQLIPLVRKIMKLGVVVLGIIFVLQNLDVNVTALLAGVSIGGLALALAAQDTVKNFIGSITIFIDQPFQIGDFIETPKANGSVVEVGVRSTRLRAPDGPIVSIPNGELVNLTVTNHGLRTYRRYSTTLGITYGTSAATVEAFVEAIQQLVVDHPKTRNDGNIIYFHEMSDSALSIHFMVYFELTAYDEWLKARQEILLDIMKLAESMNVSFAFPSTSVYVESLPEQKPQ